MMRDDFAVFILSYKRANRIATLKSLKRSGYTGKYYIMVGTDDPTLEEYKKLYPDNLYIFDKDKLTEVDPMDNFGKKNCILWARNQCFKAAKELGLKYFIELDDDYSAFYYITLRNQIEDKWVLVYNMDDVLNEFIKVLDLHPNIKSVAFSQTGDFIGGLESEIQKKEIKRKAMNSFINCVDKPWLYTGTLNEDVNAYTMNATRGDVFITLADIQLKQRTTQQNSGGITDLYQAVGTYVKSFYSVMACPSGVRCGILGPVNIRVHHKIRWANVCPKIISDKYKKK